MSEVLELFHPEIAGWFRDRYGNPTEVQIRAWPAIASGNHVLLTAPTGTGKTLAAFLWAIDRLVTGVWEPGLRVLYTSPLKALNNDIHRNLIEPLGELEERFASRGIDFPKIAVRTRSGDTPQSERRKIATHPPAILITTPESLNLMLSSPRSREIFSGVETVILDEIHAVAGEKRGTHLMSGVERLILSAGEVQRIALSATIKPIESIGTFVAGYRWTRATPSGVSTINPRPIDLVEVSGAKHFELTVRYLPSEAAKQRDDSIWERIADEIRPQISGDSSNLIFVNSRRLAERLTHLINDSGIFAFAHHGSLAKELRLSVEKRLKDGTLRAIVATSSLEMGIDIGDLDSVFLVETPFSVSSAVQRLGRSGHTVGRPSVGTLYASHGRDLLDALVLTRLVSAHDIEPIEPIEAPLDVLAQVLIAMIGLDPWSLTELYDFIRTCAAYRHLSRKSFDDVIEMLAGRYQDVRIRELKPRILLDRETESAVGVEGSLRLVYANGGTIPDRGYYRLALAGSNATIGELDEEFVWERRVGDTFSLGTQNWKIMSLDHQKVTVVPHSGPVTLPPFWKGEGVHRGFHLASRVADALEEWDGKLERHESFEDLGADEATTEKAVEYLRKQRGGTGVALPHRHHLVVEETTLPGTEFTQVFVHTFWGNRINYPFAIALEAMMSDQGWIARSQSENDCIHLAFPNVDFGGSSPCLVVRDAMQILADIGPEDLIREHLESTGFFGGRFREAAGRALLLPRPGFAKRSPLWLNRLKAKRLAEQIRPLRNFPITVEAWRTTLKDHFELDTLDSLMGEIARGEISISAVKTEYPSPFTEGVVWDSMNSFVYTDDVPETNSGTSVDEQVLRAAVFGEERPELDREIATEVAAKLERTYPGYSPPLGNEFLTWIEERLLLGIDEWDRLLNAVKRDHEFELPSGIDEKLLHVKTERFEGVATIESAALLLAAGSYDATAFGNLEFGPLGSSLAIAGLSSGVRSGVRSGVQSGVRTDDGAGKDRIDLEARILLVRSRYERSELSSDRLTAQWLSTRGPEELTGLLGLAEFGIDTDETVESLVETETAIVGKFFSDSTTPEICDVGNLERILQSMRNRGRRRFDPVPLETFAPYLASRHGVIGEASLNEVLSRLEGYAMEGRAWEESVLPSRIKGYRPDSLDSILGTTDLEWYGAGEKRVAFGLRENFDLFPEPVPDGEVPNELLDRLFPDPLGAFDFFALHERSGLSTGDLSDALWRLFWSGSVRCDSFEVLRRGILNGFAVASSGGNARSNAAGNAPGVAPGVARGIAREVAESNDALSGDRSGPRGGRRSGRRTGRRTGRRIRLSEWSATRPISGRWSRRRIDKPVEVSDTSRIENEKFEINDGIDAFEAEAMNRDRVRVILDRYGIVFKELLDREIPALRWSALFRTFRYMELSGEIAGGYFIDGVRGLQFALPQAIHSLHSSSRENIFWINATDPASLCGVFPRSEGRGLPDRVSSNYVVYDGFDPAMVVHRNGEAVVFLTHSRKPEYLEVFQSLVTRSFNPPRSIRLLTIDGIESIESPDESFFTENGFKREYKYLTLWR